MFLDVKVNLGTIEVTDDERKMLARYFGERGLATRNTVREWALSVIEGAWQDVDTPEDD